MQEGADALLVVARHRRARPERRVVGGGELHPRERLAERPVQERPRLLQLAVLDLEAREPELDRARQHHDELRRRPQAQHQRRITERRCQRGLPIAN